MDNVNPTHYKGYSVETIEMMVSIWGADATAIHCEMCAFKYSMRVGMKNGQNLLDEVGKRDWYLKKAKELRTAYLDDRGDYSDFELNKLFEWLQTPEREPAQSKFTAGMTRNVAREVEYLLKHSR